MSMPEPRVAMPVPVAVLLAWLVPGLAHFFLAERMRGAFICLGVWGLFVLGVLIGGVRIIETPKMDSVSGLKAAVSNLTFNGQLTAGPIALVTAWGSSLAATYPETAGIRSHARVREIGELYTKVAGLLNLLAMIDAGSRASMKKKPQASAAGGEETKTEQGAVPTGGQA